MIREAGYGTSPLFELPEGIAKSLLIEAEVGDEMDNLTGERDTKQEQGAAGYFTRGVMDRERIYIDDLVAALIPFLNEDVYYLEHES